jgi:hypothetical protein
VEIHIITGNNNDTVGFDCDTNVSREFYPLKNRLNNLLYMLKSGKRYNPDIVVCIEPQTMIVGLYLKKKLNCRIVYDCHEYYADAFAEKRKSLSSLYSKFEKFLSRRVDAIITVNEILVNYFRSINNNVYLCANLPNAQYFSDTFVKKRYDMVYAGYLTFERGLKVYLETMRLFKEKMIKFSFLVIGQFKDTQTSEFFFDFIEKNCLSEYIVYKPFMPYQSVLREIKASKIGIFFADVDKSPRYDKAISVKIFDYMTQSVPVLINDLQMLSELVNDAQCGWIVDFDSESLFAQLYDIINDDALLSQKGQNGYLYAKGKLIWENQESELYKAILGE